jgi:(1->4)-alpha-D-glucan 1-alpha-D-glucosylmutase
MRIQREGWGDTHISLPEGRWKNALARSENLSGKVSANDLFAIFPVALLEKDGVVA